MISWAVFDTSGKSVPGFVVDWSSSEFANSTVLFPTRKTKTLRLSKRWIVRHLFRMKHFFIYGKINMICSVEKFVPFIFFVS